MKKTINVCDICGLEISESTNKVTLDLGDRRVLWNADCCVNCLEQLKEVVDYVMEKGIEIKQERLDMIKSLHPLKMIPNKELHGLEF
jgi:hypothetical protein